MFCPSSLRAGVQALNKGEVFVQWLGTPPASAEEPYLGFRGSGALNSLWIHHISDEIW